LSAVICKRCKSFASSFIKRALDINFHHIIVSYLFHRYSQVWGKDGGLESDAMLNEPIRAKLRDPVVILGFFKSSDWAWLDIVRLIG
jgi:hypothetical protein